MLFRTVYGPELDSVFFWLQNNGPATIKQMLNIFGANIEGQKKSSSANLEDALNFLEASGLIKKDNRGYLTVQKFPDDLQFKLALLNQMRTLQVKRKSQNVLDPFFLGALDLLFIKPNVLFRSELHGSINSLELPVPCSEEKVNAWKRVLEYLGVGIRGYGGFLTLYNTELVMTIIEQWSETSGPIQQLLEEHFDKYLPWKTHRGDVSSALSVPLEILEKRGSIKLQAKQDLPSKSYLGTRKVKWIERGDF